jgi:FAD:protein FMN transferase
MLELGFEFAAMGGLNAVRVQGDDEAALHRAAAAAIAEVRRIEAAYSRYRSDSVVSRINTAAGSGTRIAIDDETSALLDFASALFETSRGRFDITAGVLRRAWDFAHARVPVQAEIEALLPLIGWRRIERGQGWIALPQAGMELDFGGFGKEYAADRAAAVLVSNGVQHGFVELGGDIRLVGSRADGSAWRLAIRHPRDPEALLADWPLAEGAIATSGDYERAFEADGRRFHHLLDPATGWPVEGVFRSVSVAAPTCAAAGAACTLALLAGAAALDFLQAQGLPFVAVDAAGCVHDGRGAAAAAREPPTPHSG